MKSAQVIREFKTGDGIGTPFEKRLVEFGAGNAIERDALAGIEQMVNTGGNIPYMAVEGFGF